MSKIRMQCRRGMLELDVILHRFLDRDYEQLSEEHKQLFATLLAHEDPTLYGWLVNDVSCADTTLQPIIEIVRKNPHREHK